MRSLVHVYAVDLAPALPPQQMLDETWNTNRTIVLKTTFFFFFFPIQRQTHNRRRNIDFSQSDRTRQRHVPMRCEEQVWIRIPDCFDDRQRYEILILYFNLLILSPNV